MIFKSRKGVLFSGMTIGFTLTGLITFYIAFFYNEVSLPIPITIIFLLSSGLLLWAYFGTKYELTKDSLVYKSGFLRGTIQLKRIHTIIKDATLLSGIKPAMASKGLIIKFDKYEEIYISPDSNDSFITHLKTLNPEIKIEV